MSTALAQCCWTGEYCAPVWRRSAHARKVNTALNETYRTITGCIRSTKVEHLYLLASIPPPDIRRTVQSQCEKFKQERDIRHPLHGHPAARTNQRLKSRKPFLGHTKTLNTDPHYALLDYWKENWNESRALADAGIQPSLKITIGSELSWAHWRIFDQLRARKIPRDTTSNVGQLIVQCLSI